MVVQKYRSDMQACQVTREEFKDCRARVKNYKGWEFVLHINCSQYRGQCPVLRAHMAMLAAFKSNWDLVEFN